MTVLDAGHTIAGKYRLVRPLARGGMGAVWVAQHAQLDTLVAIKLMDPALADSSDARARFEREAKAAAMLSSSHVALTHDYGIDGDVPYIAMELLDGEDLETRLTRVGRLGVATTAKIVGQVCKALRRAHDAGLVHRDLKPANIFLARVDDDEVVKILDFGVAKVTGPTIVDSATRTGSLIGSPHYMSPEQVRRSRLVDHRTDLWAVGVIIFRCLTGRMPFDGEEVGDVLVGICSDPIPAPSSVEASLGKDVDDFVQKALDRDINGRFQSARELAHACYALGDADAPDSPIVERLTSPDLATVAAPVPIAAPRAITSGTLAPSDTSLVIPVKRRGHAGVLGALAVGLAILGLFAARPPSLRAPPGPPDSGIAAHVASPGPARVEPAPEPIRAPAPVPAPAASAPAAPMVTASATAAIGPPPRKDHLAPRAPDRPKPEATSTPKKEPADKPYDPTREM